MIHIEKSTAVPVILVTKGELETSSLCNLYSDNPEGYSNGTVKFTMNNAVFGHESVKSQLIAEQHGKCCFCESDFRATSFGDVEHYRPKGGYKKTSEDRQLNRPGYYWLAYNWENLFFSCEVCNRREKKNYFPIIHEMNRAVNHTHDILVEQPLLLHPSLDYPEKHIRFNQHVPVALDERGKVSIEGYGLGREELNRIRERHYWAVMHSLILAKYDPISMSEELKNELCEELKQPWSLLELAIFNAKKMVQNAAKSDQPFANMVRSNFPELSKSR
ncbi:hypothetical protein [Larkinella punicea]|nr:hypothetical protein [Larkinella punicea]